MKKKVRKIMDYKCLGPAVTVSKIKRLQGRLQQPQMEQQKKLINLLAGETRFNIIYLLFQEKELCVCDLADILHTTVSAISHQLKVLKKHGLVRPEKKGQTVFYILSKDTLKELKNFF